MTEPTTAAGRALRSKFSPDGIADEDILAIEAEASRATVERIRAAVGDSWVAFGEEWTTEGTEPGTRVPLIRAANLHAILDAEAKR